MLVSGLVLLHLLPGASTLDVTARAVEDLTVALQTVVQTVVPTVAQTAVLLVGTARPVVAVAHLAPVAAVASPHAMARMTAATVTMTAAIVNAPGVESESVTARMIVNPTMTGKSRTTVSVTKSARVCHYHFATSTIT
jgi:hypothetical protein